MTYLLVGLVLFKFVEGLRLVPRLASALYYLSVLLALAVVRLGHIVAGSIRDRYDSFGAGTRLHRGSLSATILLITETRGVGLMAFSMLAGYNVAFIVQLVAVFVLLIAGVTGGSLSAWLERWGAAIKLATAVLFILLRAALVFMRG